MSEIRQAQEAIKEGFICANCRRQLGSVEELLSHYDICQRSKGEGDNGAFGLKGFLGKAKQKLRFEGQSPSPFSSSGASGLAVAYSEGGGGGGREREKGSPNGPPTYYNDFDNAVKVEVSFRSSFQEFKKIRSGRMERYAAESNKLKIRLSKLVSGLEKFPNLMVKSTAGFQDSAEWKAHEKSVVNWLEEKPVTRCPECAQSFSLLKRKHHCRLCGSILCHECSDFIPLNEAFDILHAEKKIRNDAACNSITFRACAYCANTLRQESQNPFKRKGGDLSERRLLELYDKIREKMTEIDGLLPQLVTVVDSIRSGETLYSREEANLLRSKLLRANEQIDLLSKQISALNSESGSMIMLQQRIRQSCVAFIREFIRTVPVVPDSAEDTASTSSSLGGGSGIITTGEGWSISAPGYESEDHREGGSSADFDDNPIQQQIKNVKFYIQQAQAAGRTDEVDMLASSLRDLLLWQNEQEEN